MFADLVEELIATDDDALAARLRTNELAHRRLGAEQAAIVNELQRRSMHLADGHRSIKGYLKAELNWSNQQVRSARSLGNLVDHVPGAGDALSVGHIGVAQAQELGRLQSNPRIDGRLAAAAPVMLDHAEHLSFEDFRVVSKSWESFADEDGSHDDRVQTRSATVLDVNGELFIQARGGSALEVAEMVAVFDRFVEREFRKDCAEREAEFGTNAPTSMLPRTDAQRRRDALQEIFRAAESALTSGLTIAPLPTVLNIIVDQYDFERHLAGADLIPRPTDLVEPDIVARRQETSTGTPLPGDEIVKAAIHGRIRRVLMDSKGVITDFGRERRLFSGPIRIAAKLMGHTCSHPGCDIPAEQCEIDHLQEFIRDNGTTSLVNSDITCTSHNRFKHRAGLTRQRVHTDRSITRRADGTAMLPVGRRLPPERDDDSDGAFPIRRCRFEAGRLVWT